MFDVHQVGHFDLQLKEVTLVAGCLTSSDMVFKAIAIAFNLKLNFNLQYHASESLRTCQMRSGNRLLTLALYSLIAKSASSIF